MSAQFDSLGNSTKDITGFLMVSPMSKTRRVLILHTDRLFPLCRYECKGSPTNNIKTKQKRYTQKSNNQKQSMEYGFRLPTYLVPEPSLHCGKLISPFAVMYQFQTSWLGTRLCIYFPFAVLRFCMA